MKLEDYIHTCQQRINKALSLHLPKANPSVKLHTAMRYAVLNGGKRLRPLLVYASGEACGASYLQLDTPASAVEFIHAYSLIHDDLPAMDNDDIRRGQPTCHKAFDEATAILAGDALQSLAFSLLVSDKNAALSNQQRLEMVKVLAHAAGSLGMVGGQALDLAATGKPLTFTELESIHRLKTGCLISAAVNMGVIAAGVTDITIRNLFNQYALCIGQAFQIQDDILDIEGDIATLGKQTGADQKLNKATYPAIMGITVAKQYMQQLLEQALECLKNLGKEVEILRQIAAYIIQRKH